MKKIFTLFLVAAGLLSFNAASAQNRNDRYGNQAGYPVYQQGGQWNQHGGQQSNGQWDQSGRNQSRDYGYDNRRRRNNDYNRQEDYRRQQEYDRMNQQCDERIEGYRNDRRMDNYERNRRIQEVEYERQQKAKAFGKGVVVGGIAAILIGVLIGGGR
ncbi:MAG: hypothetical protein ABUT20_57485 [Bacteroidota bacterium]